VLIGSVSRRTRSCRTASSCCRRGRSRREVLNASVRLTSSPAALYVSVANGPYRHLGVLQRIRGQALGERRHQTGRVGERDDATGYNPGELRHPSGPGPDARSRRAVKRSDCGSRFSGVTNRSVSASSSSRTAATSRPPYAWWCRSIRCRAPPAAGTCKLFWNRRPQSTSNRQVAGPTPILPGRLHRAVIDAGLSRRDCMESGLCLVAVRARRTKRTTLYNGFPKTRPQATRTAVRQKSRHRFTEVGCG
jgi:hypothetical protein